MKKEKALNNIGNIAPAENKAQNKRESGVSRIVGVEKSDEASLLDFFKAKFESEQKDDIEKEHSKELDGLINAVNDRLRYFLKEYGIDSIPIPAKNIHIVDWAKLTPQQAEIFKKKHGNDSGIYLPEEQHIGIFREYEEGKKLAFLQTLVHEMIHFNSFLSF